MKVQTLLACTAAVLVCGLSASAQPQTSSKAFDYFDAAASAIVDEHLLGATLSAEAREKLVERNEQALSLLRQGLAYDYHRSPEVPLDAMIPRTIERQRLSRLLVIEGNVKAARDEWNAAANSYIDAVKLGNEIIRDGPLIDLLVGMVVQTMGFKPLEKSIASLDEKTARHAARRLESIFLSRPSFKSTLQAELQFGERKLLRFIDGTGDGKYRDEVLKNFRNLGSDAVEEITQPYIAFSQIRLLNSLLYPEDDPEPINEDDEFTLLGVEDPAETARMFIKFYLPILPDQRLTDENSRTRIQMLMSALAIRAYQAEHGKYPKSLEELVPIYLEKVPMDSFGWDAPLRYENQDDKYLLYSLGPDGREDGGQPIAGWSVLYAQADAQGDIVFGVNN